MKQKAAPAVDHRTPSKEVADARPAPQFKPPFKPRRRLFYALLGLLGVWVAVLIVMYFVTVYPTRKQQPTENPSAPIEKTVPRK